MNKIKSIIYREEAQQRITEGARQVYEVARAAYGPRAGNVLIRKPYGPPVLSRDGVTNVQEVVLDDQAEDDAAQVIIEASKKSNQRVGDGTTAVVILAYHLLRAAQRLALEYNPMEVAKMLDEASVKAVAHVDKLKKKATRRLVQKVAAISSGDAAVGQLIAESIEAVGLDGGVTVEDSAGLGISNEVIDGFYFKKGFTHPYFINNQTQLRAEYTDCPIIITEKRLSTSTDIVPILGLLLENKIKEVVFVGEVVEEALQILALNKRDGVVTSTVVEPPVYAGGPTLFLEDLAIITGGTVYTAGSSGDDFKLLMLGTAKKVVITEFDTTIIGAEGPAEDVAHRVAELRDQLATAEHPITVAALKDRLSKLTGKIALIRVGGALGIDQGYQKLRVEDAVCAVQAAMRDGIVPGGGVALAGVTGTPFDEAFKQPLMQLAENAGANPQKLLAKLEGSGPWDGFNLTRLTENPVNLLKEGVIDPALVVKETIINASVVAANLVTTGAIIDYGERPE